MASLAAVVGRSFTFPVLLAGSKIEEDLLLPSLDELWQRRIVRSQGLDSYDFSHDRIREVAYLAISPVQRPALHSRIAEALLQVNTHDLDSVASQLAAHYAKAGMGKESVTWYLRAAQVQRTLHAHETANALVRSGLAQLEQLPQNHQRMRQEAALLMELDLGLQTIGGLSEPKREPILIRARELLNKVGDHESTFFCISALIGFYTSSRRWRPADELEEQLESIAQESGNPWLLARSLTSHSQAALWRDGDFVRANELVLLASKQFQNYDLLQEIDRIDKYQKWSPWSNWIQALTLWLLGYPEQSHAAMEYAIAEMEAVAEPLSHTNILFSGSMLYRGMGDVSRVEELAAAMTDLGTRYELPMSIFSGQFCAGWVKAQQGDFSEGISMMMNGIDGFRQNGHTLNQTNRLATLAEACIQTNRLERAEVAIAEAWNISTLAHEHWWDAELHRVQGLLAQAQGKDSARVERHYTDALELAQTQQAKAFELRAASSLAAYWAGQGKTELARDLLAPVVAWFTEGFDTADFKHASSLLKEL